MTFRSASLLRGGLQQAAFMDMIAWAEGTSSSPITQNDGYDIIVNSVDAAGHLVRTRFDDYSDHPFANGRKSLPINSKGLTSNASGRGQIMLYWWRLYKVSLKLPDFSPDSQDRYMEQQLIERKAIPFLLAHDLYSAIEACSNIWASLPGKGNTYNQGTRTLDSLKAAFLLHGGVIK